VAVGALVTPASRLIVGRSGAVPYRAGDRVDVRWTVAAGA
jgi:hypothetical protein